MILSIIGGAIALIIIGFLIVAAMQPKEFVVTRTATMAAPASAIFEQFDTLENWNAWSPWKDLDPNMEMAYSGPASGEGASFSWRGNNKAGEGTLTILASRPSEEVDLNLQFVKPFKATNGAKITFKPQGAGTLVTWKMSGERNFMFKAMGLLMDCDKMIGKDFEKGLSRIKSIVEKK
ncbi:SRPBCC family protein [soil metagenome]